MPLTITIIVGILFVVLGLACVVSVALGLPGAWILLGLAIVIEVSDRLYLPAGDEQTFPWWLLGVCLVLAIIGEILELVAGALGAQRAGSSRRGMIGALIGGIIGAFAGVPIPVPLVGSLIGAVLGTFVGAVLGELSAPDTRVRETIKPATGATIGRILGTLSKMPIAVAIWCALSVAAFWP